MTPEYPKADIEALAEDALARRASRNGHSRQGKLPVLRPEGEPQQPGDSILQSQGESDLAGIMRDGLPDYAYLLESPLGEHIFYEDVSALFVGDKKSGKSWLMLAQAAALTCAGRPVFYFDFENGPADVARRLKLLGVTPEQASHLHHFYAPALGQVEGLADELHIIARNHPGALVIFDSLRALLSRYGLKVSDPGDVEKFLGAVMDAVKKNERATGGQGLTVITIDHPAMETDAHKSHVAGWSAAKGAAVDVVYFAEKTLDFDELTEGTIELTVKDDRRGALPAKLSRYRIGGQGHDAERLFLERSTDAVGDKRTATEALAIRASWCVREQGKPMQQKTIAVDLGVLINTTLRDALKLAVLKQWLTHEPRKPYKPGAVEPPLPPKEEVTDVPPIT